MIQIALKSVYLETSSKKISGLAFWGTADLNKGSSRGEKAF